MEETGGGTNQGKSTRCDHCQYYPESHFARCIGKLGERSGSIAYILRHKLEREMLPCSDADKYALAMIRVSPLGFDLIEKVRQRYHECPLGNSLRIEKIPSADHFIVSTELNGYEGYRTMMTNARSEFEPMSHDDWHRWYRAQVRLLTRPQEYIGCKALLPERRNSSGVRYLHYTVVETDATTGWKLQTYSPRIPIDRQARYIRLELTPTPLADTSTPEECRGLGLPRLKRCTTDSDFSVNIGNLMEDVETQGYPIATLASAPLKQWGPRQRRELHFTIEDGEECDLSDIIPLAGDDRYLRIFLTED